MKTGIYKYLAVFIALILIVGVVPFAALAEGKEQLDKSPNTVKATIEEEEKTEGTTPKKSKIDIFNFGEKNIRALYKAYSGKFTLSPIYIEHPNVPILLTALNSLHNNPNVKAIELDVNDVAEDIEASFLFVLSDGTRRIYTLNKNNRIQAGTEGFMTIPAETYKTMLDIYNTDYKNASFVQWLIYMVPSNLNRISIEENATGEPIYLDENYVSAVVQMIRSITVADGKSYYPIKRDFEPGNGKVRVMLYFDKTDSYYTLWLVGNKLYVESNELHIGCEYTISTGQVNKIINAIKNPATAFPAATPAA